MPKILVNKLTILAYLADEPNRNDAIKASMDTTSIFCDVEYCLIYDLSVFDILFINVSYIFINV
jgi:hypothetical protein